MTIYYIDPENGNDANAGTSWATAWKTIKSGATAARIAPGDVIRIAKSPDPVDIGNAMWTNLSKTVTLATALTANIDLCNAAWTASANVTTSLPTTYRKEGANNVQLLIAAAFITGKIGYRNLGTPLNLAGYTKVSLRYRQSVALSANAIKLCLCSDASGDVIVDEFIIPAIETAQINANIALTIAKGAALGSAIQSVALYAMIDPGTPTIQIDNIIACNDFSHTSLISKNPNATGGEEAWYPIQSINGTTILIDNGPATIATAGRGYYGTTETVNTYRRECFRMTTSTDCAVQGSGTIGNVIAFEGGCNTITGEQDGETFFDVGSGAGNGIDLSSRSYLTLNRLNMVRAAYGMYMNGTTYCTITANSFSGNGSNGVYCYYSSYNQFNIVNCCNNIGTGMAMDTTSVIGNTVAITNANNNLAKGLAVATNFCRNRVTITNACNNAASNLYVGASSHNNIIKCTNNKNSGAYAVEFLNTCKDNLIVGMTTSGNTSGAISHPSLANNYLLECTLGETIKVSGIVNFSDTRLQCQKHGGEYSFIYTDYGNIQSQGTVRHTESDVAWKLSPTNTNRSAYYPLTLPVATLAVNANAMVTVSCWFRRTNAGITGALYCRGAKANFI
jgi:hypothetical protein